MGSEEHLDFVCRLGQLNLGELSRERLEQVFVDLLEGQAQMAEGIIAGQRQIYQSLGKETQATKIVMSQQAMIQQLTEALSNANMVMGMPPLDDLLRTILVGMLEAWPDQQVIESGLAKAFRALRHEGETFSNSAEDKWIAWPHRDQGDEPVTQDTHEEETSDAVPEETAL